MSSISAILAGIILLAPALYAQVPSSPDSSLQEILTGLEGSRLSLQAATEHALENATSVRKAEAVYLAAEGSDRKESGLFDPQLFFNLSYQDQSVPTVSLFAGATVLATQTTSSRSGIRMDLPTGTNLELAVNTVRLATNSTTALLNPEYDAFGSLSFRQPLLGGFMVSARKQVRKAERNLDAAKARYDQQVLAVSCETERVYWDLYAAERDYAVQKLTHDRAEAFLRETDVRARAGLIGPNQVASARTFLAEQKILLLDRLEQLDRQSDQLASLIGVRPDAGQTRFIVRDEPPREVAIDPADTLVRVAQENNLDLQAARQDVEAARALASAAGWEALPSINLVGSLGGSGLAGNAQRISIFGIDTSVAAPGSSFQDALSQVRDRLYPNWNVGVEVNIPIGFRSGLGEKERLEAEVISAEQRYIEQARALEERVRSTHRELSNGRSRLEAAREGVDAAQEQVRIGLIEFSNGRSTAFELVRLGADFAVAQRRYSEALVRTAKASATLRQLTSATPAPVR